MNDLPIDPHLPGLVEAARAGGGLVLVAEPGSGKTTRFPPALVDSFEEGEVWVLEPRRIAARLAAGRPGRRPRSSASSWPGPS